MIELISPVGAGALLFVVATAFGMLPVARMIRIHEARHELKIGSAGRIRNMMGWSIIAFWLMTVWFIATIIGDWGASGDLAGAIDRGWLRLRILLEIAATIAESD